MLYQFLFTVSYSIMFKEFLVLEYVCTEKWNHIYNQRQTHAVNLVKILFNIENKNCFCETTSLNQKYLARH